MYRSGKNCSTQNCIQKAIWHICQFLTTTPSVKKKHHHHATPNRDREHVHCVLKIAMNAGHCNGVKKKLSIRMYKHIFVLVHAHISYEILFFQHLFTYFIFFSSIFREKKTLNENKCESHFGPVYLLCISVCVKLRTMMKNNNKRTNKNSWWNFVRFSSYREREKKAHYDAFVHSVIHMRSILHSNRK